FENDEKDLTQPAFAFTMNDEKDFAHATEFVNHSFTTQDRTSLQWKALKIYQQLLALHSNDANKDAFIDADLNRLNFVYANTILPNKKSLYQNALENIENNFSSNPLSGLASVRLVQLMLEGQQMSYNRNPSQKTPFDYRPAKKKLETIIAKFPKDEAG